MFIVISIPIAFAERLSLIYDGNGNLISGDGKYREYNEFSQLIRVRENNASGNILETYIYHPTEDRILVKKTNVNQFNPVDQVVLYFGDYFVRSRTNVTGDDYITDTYYIKNDNGIAGEISYNASQLNESFVLVGKKFYHNDHLGSTSVITNESGDVVEQTFYDPYGAILSGGSQSRYNYEGKEFSSVTEDYDYNFRKYNPEFGIFTQPDALIPNVYDPQQLNRYSFERRNPYKYVDPTGKYIESAVDVAFISYDIIELTEDPSILNFVVLGADIAGAALPFVTGLGLGVKTGTKFLSEGKVATKLTSNEIGRIGENKLRKEFGGKAKAFFTPSGEKRVFDEFSSGIGRESKVGYQSLTSFNKAQIDKTAELLSSGQISRAENYFFTSPVTGKGGASSNLLSYAEGKGIKNIQKTKDNVIKNTFNKFKNLVGGLFG